jgi:DNA methyltransferase 1-associated protein 1
MNSLTEQETMRKAYLTGLFERTPDQMAEEEALTIELRRLEQTERRFAKEREDLLRTLGGIESGLAGLKVDPDASAAFSNDAKRKKRRLDGEIDSPGSGAANLISLGLSSLMPPKRKDSIKQAAYGMRKDDSLAMNLLTPLPYRR